MPSAVLVDSDFGPCGPSSLTFCGLRPAKRSQHVPAGQVEFLDRLFDILFGRHRLFGILRNVRLLRLILRPSIAGSCTVSSATDGLSSVSSDVSASCVLRKPSSMRGGHRDRCRLNRSPPNAWPETVLPHGIHLADAGPCRSGTRDDPLTVQWSSPVRRQA